MYFRRARLKLSRKDILDCFSERKDQSEKEQIELYTIVRRYPKMVLLY